MDLGGVNIEAISVGGLETCIQLPGAKLAFDIGRCPGGMATPSIPVWLSS